MMKKLPQYLIPVMVTFSGKTHEGSAHARTHCVTKMQSIVSGFRAGAVSSTSSTSSVRGVTVQRVGKGQLVFLLGCILQRTTHTHIHKTQHLLKQRDFKE